MRRIWGALGARSYKQPAEHLLAIKLLMILPFRGVELIHGEWREIDFEEANWIVPRNRIKTRSSGSGSFLMPLPPMALSLLDILRESTGDGKWIFPAPRKGGEPVEVKTIGQFITRNQEKGIFEGVKKFVKHDFRRSIATNMGKLGVDEGIVGRCLNHKQSGVTSRVYNLWNYEKQKRSALQLWEGYLEEVIK